MTRPNIYLIELKDGIVVGELTVMGKRLAERVSAYLLHAGAASVNFSKISNNINELPESNAVNKIGIVRLP